MEEDLTQRGRNKTTEDTELHGGKRTQRIIKILVFFTIFRFF